MVSNLQEQVIKCLPSKQTHRADGNPSLSVELKNKALSAIRCKHMKGIANKEKNIWKGVFIYGTQLLSKQTEV